MISTSDQSLRSAIDAIIVPGVMIGHRLIAPGDEHALAPEEVGDIAASVVERRRASGAARIVARALLRSFGQGDSPIPRAPSGAPIWPTGIIGSLAHDREMAVAAVAACRDIRALGIDIEPAEPLPRDLVEIVAAPDERPALGDDPLAGRLLFAAKEAVYKAVHPLDHRFLDHHDVRIDFSKRMGLVRNGRTVELRHCVATHLVVVAFLPQRRSG